MTHATFQLSLTKTGRYPVTLMLLSLIDYLVIYNNINPCSAFTPFPAHLGRLAFSSLTCSLDASVISQGYSG